MAERESTGENLVWLVTDVARLARRNFDSRIRELGLTQPQWRAIAHLARDEGMHQAELAERLEVQPITVTRMIDRMEQAGWVRREADETDRRASRLFLTQNVQPILDELHEHAGAALDDLLAGIPEASRVQLIETLNRMKNNLTGTEASTPAGADEGKKVNG